MHETGIVNHLLTLAEAASAGNPSAITGLTFRIGALSGVNEAGLGQTAQRLMAERWGREPGVLIEVSDDLSDPGALGVSLVGIRLAG